jgi:hypothetical protein
MEEDKILEPSLEDLTRESKNKKKKDVSWILERVKNGEMKTSTAQREIFVIFGLSKSSVCRLDRTPKTCCISINTSLSCNDCGHQIK